MPDKKETKKKIDWSPREDPAKKKPSTKQTFCRPRTYDFSSVAWEYKDFWNQKEPMEELKYNTKKKK